MTEEFPSLGESAEPLEVIPGESVNPPNEASDLSLGIGVEPLSSDLSEPRRRDAANDAPPCWYWGIAEAMVWFFGTLGVHVIGGILAFAGTIVFLFLLTGKPPARLDSALVMLPLAAGEMCLFVLASMLAVSLRFWGKTFQELNFSLPDPRHVLIVVLGAVPLSLCVAVWSLPIQWGWTHFQEWFPSLKFFDQLNTMELVKEMGQSTSFLLMVLIVAVLPAIGEELVFRGAIGRVLIANIGIWGGVIVTSFIFGLIHIHPVHALAVIPLGLAIHLIYLVTRSFWMPMLLHFLNNCWAVLAGQSQLNDPTEHVGTLSFTEGLEIVTGCVAALLFGFALWQSRVRFVQPGGHEWNSGRFPIRVPPYVEIRRMAAPINSVCWGTAIACALMCHLLVVIHLFSPVFKGD